MSGYKIPIFQTFYERDPVKIEVHRPSRIHQIIRNILNIIIIRYQYLFDLDFELNLGLDPHETIGHQLDRSTIGMLQDCAANVLWYVQLHHSIPFYINHYRSIYIPTLS